MPLRVLEITGADDTDVLNTVSFYFTKHRILLSELYMQQNRVAGSEGDRLLFKLRAVLSLPPELRFATFESDMEVIANGLGVEVSHSPITDTNFPR